MNPSSPSVAAYTARGPYAVGPHEPLGNARRLMEKYAIRDLPVRAEGKLVGLLSERDLRLVWSLAQPPPETLTVEDAMTAEPYAVTPETPLEDVVREMAERTVDAAVVLEGGRVVGVFTAADAMRALVDALEGKLTLPSDRALAAARPRRGARGRAAR
ncbi:MAG: CBS domain-containing protein [Labilithrix sp.]|nr:CBS domain-containing protein [Labilithrix sp.]